MKQDGGTSDVPLFGDVTHLAHAIPRPGAYGILLDAERRVAVVRTHRGCYLPGGGLQPGESVEQALVREFAEECGLRITVGAWRAAAIDVVYATDENEWFAKHGTYADVHAHGRVQRTDPDHETGWLTLEQAAQHLTPGGHRWAVERFDRRMGDEMSTGP